ncbi:MAG: hypothetical protein JWQ74_719 [Marmoricola sp.]|nr:hypothetical protein [Marmoricola sp.]
MKRLRTCAALLTAATVALGVAACGSGDPGEASGSTGGRALVGTFKLAAGKCVGDHATGTYFRMINVNGTVAKGPFFGNPDSPCRDKSFNPQVPGTDGGLVTGTYQPGPATSFDATGNALASQIVRAGSFTAIKFGISTQKVDPGTELSVPAPRITVSDGKLSGQVTAWSASWNNLYFNQGTPKPDGTSPGLTSPLTGTYEERTGAFVLTWVSGVVGGPFNGFAGAWHLEGTFVPAAS